MTRNTVNMSANHASATEATGGPGGRGHHAYDGVLSASAAQDNSVNI